MLINFNKIKNYGVVPRGVIHVGMHKAEEYPIYIENNIQWVVFIEANERLCEEAKGKSMAAYIVNAAVSDKREVVEFNIANNGESSSILELGDHLTIYPHIRNVETVKMVTKKLDHIFQIGDYKPVDDIDKVFYQLSNFNVINLDIQGAELKAMKGLSDWSSIDAIFTEVNYREMYKGCALEPEITAFLHEKGYSKVDEVDTGCGWGDALYINRKFL